MKWSRGRMAIGVAAVLSCAGAAADVIGTHKAYLPQEIRWVAAPALLPAGAESAVLYGDPAREGRFVMRLKAPKGYRIPPHSHPTTELVTIISGELRLGLGAAADRATVEALPPGAFATMPKGVVHYAFVDDGETVIQIDSEGPWRIEYVDPKDDPRLQIAPAQR